MCSITESCSFCWRRQTCEHSGSSGPWPYSGFHMDFFFLFFFEELVSDVEAFQTTLVKEESIRNHCKKYICPELY